MKIIATTTFGLEAVLKRELIALGYDVTTENGRCIVEGDLRDIAKLNLNLRCADRVLIELLNFKATTFEDLYQGVLSLPWHEYISIDGNFIVQGRSKKFKTIFYFRLSKYYRKSNNRRDEKALRDRLL